MDDHYPHRPLGPPPPPAPSQDADSLHQRYKQLKRRYADLEHKFSTISLDLERATEQNRRLSQERDMLLDRIIEMRGPASPSGGSDHASRHHHDGYDHPSHPPPLRSHRDAMLHRALEDDSDDDAQLFPLRKGPGDYDRRSHQSNGSLQNGTKAYPPPERDRFQSYDPTGHSGSPPTQHDSRGYSHYPHSSAQHPYADYESNHPHHGKAHPHEPLHPSYGPPGSIRSPSDRRGASPTSSVGPARFTSPPEYPSHKRSHDAEDDGIHKRMRTGRDPSAAASFTRGESSTSSQHSGAVVNHSPSPSASSLPGRGRSKGRGGRSRAREGSGSVAGDSSARKRKSRPSQTEESTPAPEEEMHSQHEYGTKSMPISTPNAVAAPFPSRDRSPPVPPPSMPTNTLRNRRTPPRPMYSPAPLAPPPSGPPPRDRTHVPPPPPPPLAPPRPRSTKPKRLKAHTVQSRSFSIPTVPRNPDGGPQLPLNVGIMTVKNLGCVCLDKHFHTERYIFPVGYEVTRRYFSMRNPEAEAQYTCTILHGEAVDGGTGPRFRITASDDVDNPITAGTATGAWSVIVKAANKIRNRQHSNSVSGPDYFGLGQNTIKHLLQELDGAQLLQDYVRQHFVEGGPLGGRHAAVTAAVNLDEKRSDYSASFRTSLPGPSSLSKEQHSPVDDPDADDVDRVTEGGNISAIRGTSSEGDHTPPARLSLRANGTSPVDSVHHQERSPMEVTESNARSPYGQTERGTANSPTSVPSGMRDLINHYDRPEGHRTPPSELRQSSPHAKES